MSEGAKESVLIERKILEQVLLLHSHDLPMAGEVTEPIRRALRITPPAAPAQSNGDEGKCGKNCLALTTCVCDRLANAQATYLQFCKKHDEKMEKAIKALERIACQQSTAAPQWWQDVARAALKEISN